MRRLFLPILLLTSACYDSTGEPDLHPEIPASTTSLAELRRLYAGKPFEITADIVVSGRVVSHDRASNFYRSLILEADGTGIEVMAGIDGLHNIYPVGYKLALALNGLFISESHGILQAGGAPTPGSGYATDYIASRAALDRHLFRGEYAAVQPFVADIPSLTPSMAGTLVRIDGVHFAPEETEPTQWAGNKRFTDDDGNVLYTFTRAYADFATKEIPACEVLLVGILQCDTDADGILRYTLKLRDETDCWY